jgi:hypothetical protein
MIQRSFPEVLCPGCNIKMSVKLVLPARANVRRMQTIVYDCPKCALETTRHVVPHTHSQGKAKPSPSD